ncbi:AraC family transcriptional regulator [Streptomyces minutiscleroticus]|uniref:AraC family transcriptional regulator n=1 Tax=Streptomyces minutiscleroticus TaxID=68238 RepID=A0A918U9V4_9ACTN|nr:AraC family transcriptional regulator [Streptomyces minutiscleroticus]GGY14906.1 AraC family transcriptional regulator [Streptomyces minutiscleroticus]
MDVITEAIGGLRSGVSYAHRVDETDDWGWSHPPFEGVGFYVLLHGEGWAAAEGGPSYRVTAGDVVLCPNGARHGFSRRPRPLDDLPTCRHEKTAAEGEDRNAEARVICGAYRLTRGRVHPFLRSMPPLVAVPGLGAERALVALLGQEVAEERHGTAATRAALIDLMLVTLLRSYAPPEEDDPGIAAALDAIHENPRAPWNVRRLSEVAGLSRTVFTGRFSSSIGKPPMAYVSSVRLDLAARLLRGTTRPLSAIAHEVGYASEFAFAAAFRRKYGVPPGRFRHETPAEAPSEEGTRCSGRWGR